MGNQRMRGPPQSVDSADDPHRLPYTPFFRPPGKTMVMSPVEVGSTVIRCWP